MRHYRTATLLAGLVVAAGCGDARRIVDRGPKSGGTYQVPTGDPTGGPGGGTGSVNLAGCTYCHGTPGLDNTNADPLVAAAPPNALSGNGTAPAIGAHRAHLVNGTFRNAVECASCHLVPATPQGHLPQKQGKVSFSRLATTAWSGAPVAPSWNGTTCASTYCHGNFPNGNGANVPAWTGGSAQAQCGSCHGIPPGGAHLQDPPGGPPLDCGSCHPGYTRTSVNLALHMNGKLDGGGESTGGAACGGCHGAIFSSMNGGVTHATKHTLGASAGTNDSPTDSGVTWANPLSSNAAAARSCVNMCHGDHPHDLVSPATATHESNVYLDAATSGARADGTANRIGIGGTGGSPNRMKTDYDGTQANGGLCASCHLNPIDAGHPAVGKAAFDASAHDYASNTVGASTWSWSYQLHDGSLFVRDCTKCHASNVEGTTPQAPASGSGTVAVHFSDNASLLSGKTNPGGTAAGFVCYNCHGSAASPAAGTQGNRSGKDIQSQIAHATTAGQSGHPANGDSVHNSVAEHANATFGNALGVAAGSGQRHASCLDCHDPHQVKAGTHAVTTNVAGPPLQGAWGAALSSNPAFWTAPTSANFLKTTIVAGTDLEATLCFKCHSAYYGTLPTTPSGTFVETDQAKEFNPANAGNWSPTWASGENAGSFHPVLADCGGNLGAINMANLVTTNFAWRTSGVRNKMTCTDCHESDVNTDPNGPHGSAARYILKGPNTKWDATLQNNNGMPAGTFCANCHSPTFASSRGPMHTNGFHNDVNGYCFMCHVAIPHGSMRPGLLMAQHGGPGGVIATDQAPYNQSPVTQGLGLGSYPGTATTQWSNNNCGCGSVSNGH